MSSIFMGPRAALTLAGSAFAVMAHAQSITPSSVTTTLGLGQSITIHKSITLAPTGATNVDVLFLADNTSSMGSTISKAEAGASAILNALPSTYQYGVSRYFGDPSEAGMTPATAYTQLTPLTANKTSVQTGINNWVASGGGDGPEAGYYALQQAANTTAWRPDAQRVIVWFGDAPSHTETTTQVQAIAALQAANAKVVAFNNTSAGNGIDGRYGTEPTITRQASNIVTAVGGSLTQSFLSVSNATFVTAVTNQITDASSKLNLVFGSTFAGTGLELSFACTDLLGCNDVPGGGTRTFDLTLTGKAVGTYDFNVFAQGVAAVEHDLITVTAVPEPATYALMLTGLAGLAGMARRRRER